MCWHDAVETQLAFHNLCRMGGVRAYSFNHYTQVCVSTAVHRSQSKSPGRITRPGLFNSATDSIYCTTKRPVYSTSAQVTRTAYRPAGRPCKSS